MLIPYNRGVKKKKTMPLYSLSFPFQKSQCGFQLVHHVDISSTNIKYSVLFIKAIRISKYIE